MFPNFISYSLGDHTQSVKPLYMSEEKSSEDTLNSSYQAHDTGTWNDTWGKCPWLPHHNQCPEVHGKFHEILLGIKDKKRKTLGDNFLKRKETGLKDYKNIKGRYISTHFGEVFEYRVLGGMKVQRNGLDGSRGCGIGWEKNIFWRLH